MDFKDIKREMLKKDSWAVVGVTEDTDRYGYKIWEILKEHGYRSYGVNPKYEEIKGEKIYRKLSDIDEKIDVVDMVVSPRIGSDILDEASELGIEYIFFQPGSYDDELVEKVETLGFKYLINDCVYATLKEKE